MHHTIISWCFCFNKHNYKAVYNNRCTTLTAVAKVRVVADQFSGLADTFFGFTNWWGGRLEQRRKTMPGVYIHVHVYKCVCGIQAHGYTLDVV